ncbi:enoyl-CoA hydratase [Mycolicibacterium sp. BK556]|uniref:enoyl-CoA hydratase/isomerase family protein n=1 Tax=unclassified Mycolicibacterium TaxID=2636767 RepID=UPI00104A389A|nr:MULTISPECIES: enoyl-CoA hydratase-related protein [unclassified Mycolicibacterium]MBB3607064.1 enoyl-CoA hydratase [Mycolicibacterium sp. BK556]MBB3636826.1 enoyl-CoA hydratase [Mycolicibacterium sp. BK607]
MSDVATQTTGAVITLTIDRPKAFNALNSAVVEELSHAVQVAADDPGIRAVIITGSGTKAFSAGADLHELDGLDADRASVVLAGGQRAFRAIEQAPIPVIAAVNGLALGGGFELVLACTLSVLSTAAKLGLPESGLGLIPGYGGTQRLPRIIGRSAAAHLMLTGSRLDADRAYQLGLTPVPPVDPEHLMPTAIELAETIAAQGPRAVRAILRALGVGGDAALDAGLCIETGLAALALAGAESTEGIGAFHERRTACFSDPEVEL